MRGENEDGVSVRGDKAGAMQIGLTLDTMLLAMLAPCSYQMRIPGPGTSCQLDLVVWSVDLDMVL